MSPSSTASAERVAIPGSPVLPQVNLLPPEIRAGRQLSNLKSWLGVALLITVLAAGGLVVTSQLSLRSAQDALANTEDENAALVARQAEYAEVPTVLNQLENTTNARLVAMAAEVDWRPYIMAIAATAPAGVSIDNLAVSPPGVGAVSTSGDISDLVVAVVTFQGRSATLPDTAAWLDGLAAVPGLADPWFTSAGLQSQNDIGYYAVTGTVNVTYEGLAMRFVPTEEPADEPTGEPTAEPTEGQS